MNTLIRLKIPTSAPFIPMVVGDWNLYIDSNMYLHCRKPSLGVLSLNFSSKFRKGHTVRKSVERPLTECFEKRVIQVDDDVLTFYTKDGLSIPYNHRYTPVIMTLRDYYDYLYDVYSSWYLNCGLSKSEILDHWLVYDKPFDRGDYFNHIIDFKDHHKNGYHPYYYKLEYLNTVLFKSNGPKITVSPCG